MRSETHTDPAPLPFALDEVAFDAAGLVPVVAQDARDGTVLMLAWADREALQRTRDSRQGHYWSRSRGELWRKGHSSGHEQQVVEMRLDCDGDAVLYRVEQTGPACHTGERSCFHRPRRPGLDAPGAGGILALLEGVVDERLAHRPEGSYVARLHERGVGYVAQKVIEEAGEVAVAGVQDDQEELPGEAADLLFHLTVLLRERGVSFTDVADVLDARHRERRRGVDGTT